MLEALAQRYHATPGQILREDVRLLKHVAVLDAAGHFDKAAD